MKLFLPKNKENEVFISTWKWCFTNCQSCLKAKEKVSFLEYKKIENIIDITEKKINWPFEYFLYWTEVLKHPELDKIISKIKSKWQNYKLQITSHNTPNDFHNIKDNFLKLVLSKNIEDKKDLLGILESIKAFNNNKRFHLSIDLLINLELIKYFEQLLKVKKIKENEWIHFIKKWNITLYFRNKYNINYSDKNIDNIGIKKCLISENFEIKWDKIQFNDHIEIEENLDLTFHNPLCYLWKHKISNLCRNQHEIISDIKKFNSHINNFSWDEFSKTCFDCITKNRFSYTKND